MLKAAIICTECFTHEVVNGASTPVPKVILQQEFPTLRQLVFGVQAMLISCHAKPSHIRHPLTFRIEGEEDSPGNGQELTIRCASVGCRADTKVWTGRVPLELVGAMTIMFHTGHEGHPLQITWNGQTWETPT